MSVLRKYSILCQAPGGGAYRIGPYSGRDLCKVLGISQATEMREGTYGWMQLCGEVQVRTSRRTQRAYADFRPNSAKLELPKTGHGTSEVRKAESTEMALYENQDSAGKLSRLSQLPPLLIEVGPYCALLREARDVFVDGHFYACTAMCGIAFERFQRDKARPHGAKARDRMPQVRQILRRKKALRPSSLTMCKQMANMRNDYAHGKGKKPSRDGLRALKWLHRLMKNETDLMREYEVVQGVLHRKT